VKKLRVELSGAVQGVGFRPFVYRLALELGLAGWVLNDGRGVAIEVEGEEAQLESFRRRLGAEAPPRAVIVAIAGSWHAAEGLSGFEIRDSVARDRPTVLVLPDIATCGECLSEIHRAEDRRYRYPFTNCTNCGPRFTIVKRLPYDRPNTTMRRFALCPACRREYGDPLDRRFHAQPNACAECGPQLALAGRTGVIEARGDRALRAAVGALTRGAIVALKGIGGFLLMLDATNAEAVARLRARKRRDEKPLALMVSDLKAARRIACPSPVEEALLSSPGAPIVVVEKRRNAEVAADVAPGNPHLGLMLPYSPLHELVCRDFGKPLVATSGNLSDEPIAIDNQEALVRLGSVADTFLWHDRPIARHVDDSVLKVVAGEPQFLRRARGFAPLPVRMSRALPTMLAVGGHLKNAAALSLAEQVFLSQHIGDMETREAEVAFERVVADFLTLYEASPRALVRDLHPDYWTSRWAELVAAGDGAAEHAGIEGLTGLPVLAVQHHHAHLASCLADNGHEGPVLGVVWDGTGLGTDGTIWGGEFLVGDASSYRRLGALRGFSLPGGEQAVREPRRSALSVAWEVWGREVLDDDRGPIASAFSAREKPPLARMLESGFGSPRTSSAGRLFDAVAALLGLRLRAAFEGQAAMLLEFAAAPAERGSYPLPVARRVSSVRPLADAPELDLDWRPLVEAIVEDSRQGVEVGIISARFHNALAEAIVAVARLAGERSVALSGGCFQNRLLSERASARLEEAGFEVLRHRQVPANDGGLSLGQIAVASALIEGEPG
jgi:hydrogenase maturation protein HypF